VATREYWKTLLNLAEKHDFIVFADECYSEVYRDEPPVGALEAAKEISADPERLVVFHSLSKRSNLPGLRSGFIAAGPKTIVLIKKLRAYSGAPLPLPIQHVSEAVWADEKHVAHSRKLYQEKYDIVDEIMGDVPGYQPPQAGFFLWLPETGDPGAGFLRIALVADKNETRKGLTAIRASL